MDTADPPGLLGRSTELAALDRAVATLARGRGAVLVIEGPAGTGKTRLLDELAVRAPAALRARAVELDGDLPLGVATRLLDRPLRRQRIDWRRGRVSGTTLAETGAGPLYALAEAVVELVDRDGPQVLVVDDVQWVDQQSLALLAYLAGLAADLPLLLAIGARTGATDRDLIAFGAAPGAVRLLLADLPVESAAALVRRRLPEASDALVTTCVQVTHGNPLLLHELTTAIGASGTAGHPETPGRIEGMAPRTVTDGVLTRLGQLGATAAQIARAVAVLGDGTPLGHAVQLAELEPDEAADAADRLVAAAVLTREPELSFIHPLLGEAVLRDLGDFTRARWFRRAADVVAADGLIDRAGAHLLRTEPTADPDAVDLLRRAAAVALDGGDPVNGARLLARALAEPPGAQARPDVLTELARAEAASGDPRALEHLEAALRSVTGVHRRAETCDELSRLLHLRSDFSRALQVAERALAELPPGHPDHERLRVTWLLSAGMLPSTHERSLEIVVEEAAATLVGRPPDHPDLQAIVALHLLCTGAPEPASELAAAALGGDLDVNGPAPGYALSVLAWTGQLARLTTATERVHRAAAQRFSLLGTALAAYWQGRALLERGDLAGAEAAVRRARAPERLGWHIYRPLAAALAAEIRLEDDDLAGAVAVVDGVDDTQADGVANPILRQVRGEIALARRDFDGAADEFTTAGGVLQEVWGIEGPIVVAWRSGAALAALGREDRRLARELSTADVARAREDGVPVVLARTLRAQGLVVGDDAGLALLREATHAAATSESVLEQVRTRVELGSALRRFGARREARAELAAARAQAETAGLTALARRAREEQRASGGRPRRVAVSGTGSLTPSELRIARLAASGATNREIAGALHLSPKTVDWHLGSVFRKLDVRRRGDLGGALDQEG